MSVDQCLWRCNFTFYDVESGWGVGQSLSLRQKTLKIGQILNWYVRVDYLSYLIRGSNKN